MKGSVALVATISGTGKLQVSVEDTGIGIPLDKQKSIFTMFGKLDSGELNPQGCGLGLSISTMLVERLGGKSIKIASTPHEGSTFSFKIPISPDYCDRLSIITEENEEMTDIACEHIRSDAAVQNSHAQHSQVLIVDDVPFNRLVLRKILAEAGYSFDEASTGLEAIQHILAACNQGNPFAVVLMDIEMPEMDGITATRELRSLAAQDAELTLPVIVGCSAYCTEEDKKTALAAGMTEYLEKPISRVRLSQVLSQYCPR